MIEQSHQKNRLISSAPSVLYDKPLKICHLAVCVEGPEKAEVRQNTSLETFIIFAKAMEGVLL